MEIHLQDEEIVISLFVRVKRPTFVLMGWIIQAAWQTRS